MNILIVEDDLNLNKGITLVLEDIGEEIFNAFSINEAISIIDNYIIDLLILDLNLPDGDGLDFILDIRDKNKNFPIVILSARNLESDIILGLKNGADDYITKPFSLMVLKEKIKAIIKRINPDKAFIYKDENLRFDFNNLFFTVDSMEIELSKTEIKLLKILTINSCRIVKKEYIIDELWGSEGEFVDDNALSVAINRLRNKIIYKNRIQNEYGIGYIWKL